MKFTTLKKEEYDQFFKQTSNACFWQSPQMAEMRMKKGWQLHYVGIVEKDEIIAAATLHAKPVFLGYSLFMILRGFLIDYHKEELLTFFLNGLRSYLMEHKCLYCTCDPYLPYQEHHMDGSVSDNTPSEKQVLQLFEDNGFHHEGFRIGFDTQHEPRWMSVLPLAGKQEEELLSDMNIHTRQNIHTTIKTGIKIKELTREELPILHKIINDTGERRHFFKPDLIYYENFYDGFKEHQKPLLAYLDIHDYLERLYHELQTYETKKAAYDKEENDLSHKAVKRCMELDRQICAVKQRMEEAKQLYEQYGNEIPLAAALFVIYENEIVYLFSGSVDSLKKFKGPYALQWYMIQYGIQHQIRRYNFYGISGDFQKSAPDYGVFLFKKGFHAQVVELIGDFTYVTKPKLYKVYQTMRIIKHSIQKN